MYEFGAESNCFNLKLKYLHENESFSKILFACKSGAQLSSISEKNAKHTHDTATSISTYVVIVVYTASGWV